MAVAAYGSALRLQLCVASQGFVAWLCGQNVRVLSRSLSGDSWGVALGHLGGVLRFEKWVLEARTGSPTFGVFIITRL